MRPFILQSTTTLYSTCSSPSSLQIAPALFLHSIASLHTLAHCPVAHGFFSLGEMVLPLPLASLSRLFDHHCRLFPGGLPFRLAASKSTRFLLRLPRNVRAYWLHSCRACTSWGLPNQRVGTLWLRNQMLCPRHAVRHAQDREKETATIPKSKRLQYTSDNQYIPATLREVGPLKQH